MESDHVQKALARDDGDEELSTEEKAKEEDLITEDKRTKIEIAISAAGDYCEEICKAFLSRKMQGIASCI